MATKSFVTNFSINKNNASKIAKALQNSKPVSLHMKNEAITVKKDQIRAFFGKSE